MSTRKLSPVLRQYFARVLGSMMMLTQSTFTPQMSASELYDDLINEPALARLLRKAASYLPRNDVYHHCKAAIARRETGVDALRGGREVSILIHLSPTVAERAFLIPEDIEIDPESRLGASLVEQYDSHVAWTTAIELFKQLGEKLPINALMFCMPWLRDMALDLKAELDRRATAEENISWRWRQVFHGSGIGIQRVELERTEKSLAAMLKCDMPSSLPSMSRDLVDACRRGGVLVSQYRMLQASGYERDNRDTVRLDIDKPPAHIAADIAELLRDWAA